MICAFSCPSILIPQKAVNLRSKTNIIVFQAKFLAKSLKGLQVQTWFDTAKLTGSTTIQVTNTFLSACLPIDVESDSSRMVTLSNSWLLQASSFSPTLVSWEVLFLIKEKQKSHLLEITVFSEWFFFSIHFLFLNPCTSFQKASSCIVNNTIQTNKVSLCSIMRDAHIGVRDHTSYLLSRKKDHIAWVGGRITGAVHVRQSLKRITSLSHTWFFTIPCFFLSPWPLFQRKQYLLPQQIAWFEVVFVHNKIVVLNVT